MVTSRSCWACPGRSNWKLRDAVCGWRRAAAASSRPGTATISNPFMAVCAWCWTACTLTGRSAQAGATRWHPRRRRWRWRTIWPARFNRVARWRRHMAPLCCAKPGRLASQAPQLTHVEPEASSQRGQRLLARHLGVPASKRRIDRRAIDAVSEPRSLLHDLIRLPVTLVALEVVRKITHGTNLAVVGGRSATGRVQSIRTNYRHVTRETAPKRHMCS